MLEILGSNRQVEKLVQELDDEEILYLLLNPPPFPYYMEHVKEEAEKRGLL